MTPLTLVLASAILLAPPVSQPDASTAASTVETFPLAYVAPEDCIYFATWNRWPELDPQSANRTQKLLAEESLQDFAKQFGKELERFVRASLPNDARTDAELQEVSQLVKIAAKHPGTVFLSRFDISAAPPHPVALEGAIVIDAEMDSAVTVEILRKLVALAPQDPQLIVEEKAGDVTIFRPQELPPHAPEMCVGYRGSQIFFVIGKEALRALLARSSKTWQPPAWLAELSKDARIDRPILLTHFNVPAFRPFVADPMTSKIVDALDIGKIKHVSSIAGLDKAGIQINSIISTDGPPSGVLSLVSEKPLTVNAFTNVPANATYAAVVRMDLAEVFEKLMVGIGQVQPDLREEIEGTMFAVAWGNWFDPKADIVGAFGDTWTLYVSGSEAGFMFVPGLVLTADVRNHAGLSKALGWIVSQLKEDLQRLGPEAPFSLEEFSSRGERGYRVLINHLPIQISPTWVLTKQQLIVGLNPQLVSSHLGAAGKTSLADNGAVQAAFRQDPKPAFVSYSDRKAGLQAFYALAGSWASFFPRPLPIRKPPFNLPPFPPLSDLEPYLGPSVTTFARTPTGWRSESHGVLPGAVESLPAISGVAAALISRRAHESHEAARRSFSVNNFKQIGLAFHAFHNVAHGFPPAASTDKQGKPLLSWRVALLPYLNKGDLYKQFHLDEPWDSLHNKLLIPRMPAIFASPDDADLAKEGKTRYLASTGKGMAFEGDKGLGMCAISDGISNTIMVVEARRDAAVIWTKPDDLIVEIAIPRNNGSGAAGAATLNNVAPDTANVEADKPAKKGKDPLTALKGRAGGFYVLLADGSVRFVSDRINVEVLNALFTREGGEAVGVP